MQAEKHASVEGTAYKIRRRIGDKSNGREWPSADYQESLNRLEVQCNGLKQAPNVAVKRIEEYGYKLFIFSISTTSCRYYCPEESC